MTASAPHRSPDGPEPDGARLLATARAAIANELGRSTPMPHPEPAERAPGASFVTLTIDGRLRGCIGTLEAYRPLHDDVEENARAAAFADPRFPPLTAVELDRIRIEVSRLGPPEPIDYDGTEAGAIAALRPGVDGVILRRGRHRATFLPQVWEQLPEPREFLAHLRRKAGIVEPGWPDGIRLERYGVRSWHET